MDISEKQAFEAEFEKTDFYKMNLVNCFCFITDRYVWDEVQAAWEMWQAATTRMEILINTLDEMLLNQGEALAQAKAQAVPEGFVLIKESDRDREICELIDERDHLENQAEQLKDKLQNLYVVDFGEHSNCNFPFQNAIDFDDSDLVLVPEDSLKVALSWMDEDIDPWQMGGDSFAELFEHKPILEALIEAQEQKG